MLDLSILLIAFFFLIYASITDVKTRTIPNSVQIVILMCGVFRIFIGNFDFIDALIGLFGIGVPLLLLAVLVQNGGAMGGGDVKLCGALGFLLGLYGAYIAVLIAMISSVLYTKALKKRSAPLAPFITLGYGFTFIITILERTVFYV